MFTRKVCRAYTYKWDNGKRSKGGLSALKIIKFDIGTNHVDYSRQIKILANRDGNVLELALEAARLKCVKRCQALFGKRYHARICVYPHHIFRQHKQAKADRISTGMRLAFGVPRIRAARVKAGQTLIWIRHSNERLTPFAIKSKFKTVKSQFPIPCSISSK